MGAPRTEPRGLGTLLGTLLACLATLPATSACPRPCACPGPAELHCTFRYLGAVPPRIPPGAQRINLGYNSLRKLSPTDFAGLEKLELLMLHSNEISTIPDKVFSDLHSLQVLKMSYNKVRVLQQDVFYGLSSLARLHMDHNQIEFVNPNVFYGLTSLRLVHLDGNLLQQLHPDTFVTLRYSQIFRISFLRHISLSDNLLTSLPQEMFSYIPELESIYLHGNPWSCDCSLQGFAEWARDRPDVIKCRKERSSGVQQCPVCASPRNHNGKSLADLPSASFTCTKPVIQDSLKSRNLTMPDDGDFSFVSPEDLIAPIGSVVLNLTDQAGNRGDLVCDVQKPKEMSPISFDTNGPSTVLNTSFSALLVCAIDFEHIQQLWSILALYSSSPLELEQTARVTDVPVMSYRYKQVSSERDELFTQVEAVLRAEPGWLLQRRLALQLDRAGTTLSALRLRLSARLLLPGQPQQRGTHGWAVIARDGGTRTELSVLPGGSVELRCRAEGQPAPALRWALPDGSRVQAPHISEDGRIAALRSGVLALRTADVFDSGLYHCIASNQHDADVLTFRVTVLEPRARRGAVNGARLVAALGSTLHLPCSATAAPEPALTWVLPGRTVLRHSAGNKRLLANGTLRIQGLTQRDAGYFRCVAANRFGADLLVFQVLLTQEGTALQERQGALGEWGEGSGNDLLLSAELQGHPSDPSVTAATPAAPGGPAAAQGHLPHPPHPSHPSVTAATPAAPGGPAAAQGHLPHPPHPPHPSHPSVTAATPAAPGGPAAAAASSQGTRSTRQRNSHRKMPQWPHGDRAGRRFRGHRRQFVSSARRVDPQRWAALLEKTKRNLTGTDKRGEVATEPPIQVHKLSEVPEDEEETSGGLISPEEEFMIAATERSPVSALGTATELMVTAGPEETASATPARSSSLLLTQPSSPLPSPPPHPVAPASKRPQALPKPTDSWERPDLCQISANGVKQSTVPSGTSTLFLAGQKSIYYGESNEQHLKSASMTPMTEATGTSKAVTPQIPADKLHIFTEPIDNVSTKRDHQLPVATVNAPSSEFGPIYFHSTQKGGTPNPPLALTLAAHQQIRVIQDTPTHSAQLQQHHGRRRKISGRRRIVRPGRVPGMKEHRYNFGRPGSARGGTAVATGVQLNMNSVSNVPDLNNLSHSMDPFSPEAPQSSPSTMDTALEHPVGTHQSTALLREEGKKHRARQKAAATVTSVPAKDTASTAARPLGALGLKPTVTLVTAPQTDTRGTKSKILRVGGRRGQRRKRPPKTAAPQRGAAAHSSAESTATPAVSTATPAVTTDTPAVSTATPAASTATPAVSTATPAVSTATPAVSTATPAVTTATPAVSTATPAESTDTPAVSTATPAASTATPAAHSTAESTATPAVSTATPAASTATPAVSTATPAVTTDTPAASTATPAVTTATPAVSTATPAVTTDTPAVSTATPAVTTATPAASTATTAVTTATPAASTATPAVSTATPAVTTATPAASTATPAVSTATPAASTATPAVSTATPAASTAIPAVTTATPAASTATPAVTTATPAASTATPAVTALMSPAVPPSPAPTKPLPGSLSAGSTTKAAALGIPDSPETAQHRPGAATRTAAAPGTCRSTWSAVSLPGSATAQSPPTAPQSTPGTQRDTQLATSPAAGPARSPPTAPQTSPGATSARPAAASATSQHIRATATAGETPSLQKGEGAAQEQRGAEPTAPAGAVPGAPAAATAPSARHPSPLPAPTTATPRAPEPPRGGGQRQPRPGPPPEGTGTGSSPRPAQTPWARDRDRDSSARAWAERPRGRDTTTIPSPTTSGSASRNHFSKPRIVGGKSAAYTLLANSDAFIPCEATGNPPPTIQWTKIPSGRGAAGASWAVLPNGTLAIARAGLQDAGQYLCTAANALGAARLLVTLAVLGSPPRIAGGQRRLLTAHSGTSVALPCRAQGWPPPSISWLLANGTRLSHPSGPGRARVGPDGTLLIRAVTVYDRGLYTCLATSPAGSDTLALRLQVVAAPPSILEEKRQSVMGALGESLRLPCTAQGNPEPTVHWVLPDGTALKPLQLEPLQVKPLQLEPLQLEPLQMEPLQLEPLQMEPLQLEPLQIKPLQLEPLQMESLQPEPLQVPHAPRLVLPNGTLHLGSLAPSDSGTYECIATSSTGSDRRVVSLELQSTDTLPRIASASQQLTRLSFGDRLLLNCTASGEPKPRIIWRLPSKAVVDQWHRMGSRIHVYPNGSLTIEAVTEKDAGDYLCVARNRIGEDLILMKVSITMKPAKIDHKQQFKKLVPYGKDFRVDCKASGSPTPEISWGLPDGTVVNNAMVADDSGHRARRFVLFDNGTLHLHRAGVAEGGDYTCYAQNTLGRDEMKVHVTVVVAAPRIKHNDKTEVAVAAGDTALLDCEAAAEPRAQIFWLLPSGGMISSSTGRHSLHANGSLAIGQAGLPDAGQYLCLARNPGGDDTKLYRLQVAAKPPTINGVHGNKTIMRVTAVRHSKKHIDCRAEGTPPPQVTWIMPDNIFLPAPYYGSRIAVHENGTLEIRNIRPSDTADFICVARNAGGETVLVVQLEVTEMLRRPIFRNPFNEKIIAIPGKAITLNCSVDGNPPPDISWMLPNGTWLSSSTSTPQFVTGSDGTLRIASAGSRHAGRYRCAARNQVGYIEKLLLLEVAQKPSIVSPAGLVRAASGEPLSLPCRAQGSPRPRVAWALPGGRVLERPQASGRFVLLDNGTLLLRAASAQDAGTYLCRASNAAGHSSVSIAVLVTAHAPRIVGRAPPALRALPGAAVQLPCVALGIPKPEITWQLPDGSVLSAARPGRGSGAQLQPTGTLLLQSPRPGLYGCTATNSLGTDTARSRLHVP